MGLIDMNLSPLWQSALIDEGIDEVHWSEVRVSTT